MIQQVEVMSDEHTFVFVVQPPGGGAIRRVPIALCALASLNEHPLGALMLRCWFLHGPEERQAAPHSHHEGK